MDILCESIKYPINQAGTRISLLHVSKKILEGLGCWGRERGDILEFASVWWFDKRMLQISKFPLESYIPETKLKRRMQSA